MARFPPDPDEVLRRLLRIIKPPTPPKFFPREEEAGPVRRRRREIVGTGSKMIWPYRITWRESPTGRGQIKVLKEERTIGVTSFESRAERIRVVSLLEGILKGE